MMPARPGHRHSRREPPKTGLPAAPHSSDAAPRLFVHPSRADALSQRFARVPVACNVRFWARQGGVKSTKAAPPVSLPVRGCKRRSGANRSPGKRHAGESLRPSESAGRHRRGDMRSRVRRTFRPWGWFSAFHGRSVAVLAPRRSGNAMLAYRWAALDSLRSMPSSACVVDD